MTIISNKGNLVIQDGLIYYTPENEPPQLVQLYEGGKFNKYPRNSELNQILNSLGITEGSLSANDNKRFKIHKSNNSIILESDSKQMRFTRSIDPSYDPNINNQRVQDSISEYDSVWTRFYELFNDLEDLRLISSDGFTIYTQEGQIYYPYDDESEPYSRKFYGLESVIGNQIGSFIDFNKFRVKLDTKIDDEEVFKEVPEDSLVEITFDDHKVVITDLTEGLYVEEGLIIHDKTLSSQRQITQIRLRCV